MRRYACPRVHKTHNGHAFMISMNESKIHNVYKRVHVTVYILVLFLVITMAGYFRLQKGCVKVTKNKNLSQTTQLSKKRKSRSVVGYINGVTQFAS